MGGGVALGLLAPGVAGHLEVFSNIFLRLIKSVIAPLMFGLLVTSMGRAGSLRAMGRVGLKAVVYFEVVTTLALLIGWGVVSVVRPGDGVQLGSGETAAQKAPSVGQVLEQAVPASLMDAMARGDVLQIVVFCFLFGAACNAIGERATPVVRFAESVSAVAFEYTRYVMWLAPLGVCGAVASTVGAKGLAVLYTLGRFVGAAWAAQLLFAVGVLGTLLVVARVPLGRFLRAVREPFLVAFGTTSSAAALPQAITEMERFGIPERVLGVVMPLTLSFGLVGSTIHLAMAAFFVAQAAHTAMPLSRQIAILATLKLTSKGVAGIPRANFVILSALFVSFQLPLEGLAMLLGIDVAVDMVRTGVNIVGHCVAPAVIARWEGEEFGGAGA